MSLFFAVQAFLVNEDLGDSLDSVEALSKKHDDFEKSLAAQEEKIKVRIVVCRYWNTGCMLLMQFLVWTHFHPQGLRTPLMQSVFWSLSSSTELLDTSGSLSSGGLCNTSDVVL